MLPNSSCKYLFVVKFSVCIFCKLSAFDHLPLLWNLCYTNYFITITVIINTICHKGYGNSHVLSLQQVS